MSADSVIAEIAAERHRQIGAENHSIHDDDRWRAGELARGAAVYALLSTMSDGERTNHADAVCGVARFWYSTVATLWPWHPSWFKPKNPRRDLVRAGALIVAEIERLDRADAAAAAKAEGRS